MDTRVSLEVFFVKTNEICHTYKPANSRVNLSLQTRVWDFQNIEVHGIVIRNQNKRFQLNIAQFHH